MAWRSLIVVAALVCLASPVAAASDINKFIGQLAQTRMLKDGKTRLTQQHNFNAVSLHSQLTNEINQAIDRFNSKDSSSTQATSLDIESSLYNLE